MRLLWHSAAAHAASGYGAQTALVAPRLQGLGHDIAISCAGGLEGGQIAIAGPREPIRCFPTGTKAYSLDMIEPGALYFGADAVVTLFDAWVYNPELIPKPWICYFPVDCEPLPTSVKDVISEATVRLAMSRFGQRQVEAAGLDCEFAPHCFDPRVYYPRPQPSAALSEGADRFVVGVVAANGRISNGSPPRKAFAQLFEGFAMFHRKHSEAALYVHADQTDGNGGIDLDDLRQSYGIPDDAFRTANPFMLQVGAYTPNDMAAIYSAMDVLLAPTMGEGFGVPILEAQACGTPVITGDWTAMPEITIAGRAIAKTDAFRYRVPNYGDQFLVHPVAVAEALTDSLDWAYDPADVAMQVSYLAADTVVETYWKPLLDKLSSPVEMPRPTLNRADRRKLARAR